MILAYQGSFSGHVVVIYGYDDSIAQSPYLFIHDPYFGSFYVPYSQSQLYSGSSFWVDTILTYPSDSRSMGWAHPTYEQIDWSRVHEYENDGRLPGADENLESTGTFAESNTVGR